MLLSSMQPVQENVRHWWVEKADSLSSVRRWNGYTSFLTTGAGSWGEPNDSCGSPGSYLYSNGGEPACSQAIYSSLQTQVIPQEV